MIRVYVYDESLSIRDSDRDLGLFFTKDMDLVFRLRDEINRKFPCENAELQREISNHNNTIRHKDEEIKKFKQEIEAYKYENSARMTALLEFADAYRKYAQEIINKDDKIRELESQISNQRNTIDEQREIIKNKTEELSSGKITYIHKGVEMVAFRGDTLTLKLEPQEVTVKF